MTVESRWDIPDSWAWTEVGALGEVVGGGTPSTKEPSFWGDEVNWISPADLTGYTSKTISRGAKGLTEAGLNHSAAKVMPEGSVHFSSRAPIGYVVISAEPLATNQGFKSLVPADGVLDEYVYYYLRSAKQYAERRATGTTFLELSGRSFSKLPIPVAPSNEQPRIVAKVEELLSELDKGVESLETARMQLQAYRQAVLKHAFEGKLTEKWREENKDNLTTSEKLLERIKSERNERYDEQIKEWELAVKEWEENGKAGKKPSKPRAPKALNPLPDTERKNLANLPDGWSWNNLGWMTCGVEYGTSAKSSEAGDVPVLRMGNIQNGKFDWSDLVYTSDKEEIAKYDLSAGDVLFNRTNSPELVGKAAIYRGEKKAIFAGYLIRVNQMPGVVDSQYLNLYLNSYTAKQYGNRVKTDGVNQSNINGEKLQNYPFPYCSIDEQNEIVRVLEEKLSIIDQMASDIYKQLSVSTALKQSILKRAFSGQLVEQDPKDEPASELLARIKAEKDDREKAKKAGKKKVKKKSKRKDAA